MLDQRLIVDVPAETVKRIEASGERRTFPPDAFLFHVDDEPIALFQILSGRVRFWRSSENGDPFTLAYRTAGTFLGFPVIHRRASHTVNATADTAVVALVWSGGAMRLFTDEPLIQRNALAVVTGQMHRLMARLEEQRSVGAETRLARALCKIATEIGERLDDGALCMPITRQELADYAGVTLHTASRVVSRWTGQGMLRPTRGRIIVLDAKQLSLIA